MFLVPDSVMKGSFQVSGHLTVLKSSTDIEIAWSSHRQWYFSLSVTIPSGSLSREHTIISLVSTIPTFEATIEARSASACFCNDVSKPSK